MGRMNKEKEIEFIKLKYQKLFSEAWNNTSKYTLDQIYNEVIPMLEKEIQKEIDKVLNS